jgi:RimJ/RimL family protein N-acetyltransferase
MCIETSLGSNSLIFETRRLRCRRWRAEDLEELYAVYSDPKVVRWVGDGVPITRNQCQEWLGVTQRNYAERGYGMFVLEDRATGATVGFCGIVHPGGQPEAEIKYAFSQPHWGQGLATEAVTALLPFGASEYGLQRIIATVAPENFASQRVLWKAGMSLIQERLNDNGTFTLVYEWFSPSP